MGHRDDLLRLMNNSPEDLEANRAGRLSPRQARRIAQSGVSNLLGAVFIAVALAVIVYAVANKPLMPVQWGLAGLLAVIVLIVGYVDFNRTRQAAADARVEVLAGPVRVEMRRREGWFLVIAGRSLRLPVRPWNVKNDAPYRVYFAPKANRIVALEPDGWD